MASKQTRGKIWSEKETKLLLTCWSEETIQIALNTSKCTKDTNRVYRNLLLQMQEKGYKYLTLEQIVNKMKKLRQKYKTEKDKTRKTGNSKAKKWKYCDQIDNFMSQKHNVTPVAIVDTMDQHDEPDEVDESELVDKYGKGKSFVQKCKTCDYEQAIRTDYVHTTEGGALIVYEEAETFSCPNCDFEATIGVDHAKQDEDEDSVDVNANDEDEENFKKVEKEDREKEKKNEAKFKENQDKEKEDGEKSKYKLSLSSKKRKSGVEKSLELVFDQFKQANSDDFERFRKLEEMRIEKEHEFQREQSILESERRKQGREHELKILSLLMGNQSQINNHALHAPTLHATNVVYHANPYPLNQQQNILTDEDKTFFQF